MKHFAYTLAEITVTLAIIGVVGALTIPVVLINTQQAEYETSYKKVMQILNQAITLNITEDQQSPLNVSANTLDANGNTNRNSLAGYLTRRMTIAKTLLSPEKITYYTPDGLSFTFSTVNNNADNLLQLDEIEGAERQSTGPRNITQCGSFGLELNPKRTTTHPCVIEVDVNGDKKPNPTYTYRNEETGEIETRTTNININTARPSDAFYVLITEDRAIPYGAAAQRVLYNNEE